MKDDVPHQQVLDYWFGEEAVPRPMGQRWFGGTPEIDAQIRDRFGSLHAEAARGALDGWAQAPLGAIALMVVLDQFSRNLHRGDAQMFAHDARALALAREALQDEATLAAAHRAAIYLAMTHSEDVEVVREAVAGFSRLLKDPISRGDRRRYKRMGASARRHLRVLERFGRYPHRNPLLGRQTTREEATYLATDRSRFVRSVRPHAPKRLRILVLHSFRQSARRLESRLRRFAEELSDIVELVFVDAPHTYEPDDSERAMLEADFGAVPDYTHQRCWWHADAENRVYEGWEDSIRVIDAHLPADGILGFSQGSSLTGLFCALRTDQIRFAICISGFPSRADAHQMLTVPGSIDLPSLHIYGEADVLVDNERTKQLAACFVDPQIASHPGGHFFPELFPIEAIRSFLFPFLDAPPPVRQLDDPSWRRDMSDAAIAQRLPGGEALEQLLIEARAAFPTVGSPPADLTAPRSGDLAHRIWIAAWRRDPDRVRAVLASDTDWRALAWLALRAAQQLEEPDALIDAIATRFAAQIQEDEANEALSHAAEAAPRTKSGLDRISGLGRRIALLLDTHSPHPQAYAAYRRRVVASSQGIRALRRRARGIRPASVPSAQPASEVTRPRPVPVVPCPLDELDPLLRFLDTQQRTLVPQSFPRGTVTPDGRLDLCKQVVGPAGIGPLLSSLADHTHIDRLLLGNNVVGRQGGERIARFIRSGHSRVRVWYIAGNELDRDGVAPICEALADADEVQGLWLKRNPLGPEGAEPVAALLRTDPSIDTLDLVNTGLLDAGALAVIEALDDNHTLRHLYLGTNGLTPAVAPALARTLSEHDRLHSLYIDCNRLGDEGVAILVPALARNRNLRRLSMASNRIGAEGAAALASALVDHPSLVYLSLGWTRATDAVREAGNRIGDRGAEALAGLLRSNATLRSLDIAHNGISQRGLDHIRDALADNTTLVELRHPQRGKATNTDSIARLRGRVDRNRRAAGLQPEDVEAIRTPKPTREVLSVYRTAPMAG